MIHQSFSRTIYNTLVFQECTEVHCDTRVLLAWGTSHRSQSTVWTLLKLSPGAGWCSGPCALPPHTSADANPSESRKQQSPPSPPHPHGETRRAAEFQTRGERESNPYTKGIGRADNQRHRFPLPASKVYGFVYLLGQLCWHRHSLGNVRHLKIEQMFLLKGLLQCSA